MEVCYYLSVLIVLMYSFVDVIHGKHISSPKKLGGGPRACRMTYYIQDYHVHTSTDQPVDAVTSDGTPVSLQSPPIGVVIGAKSSTGGSSASFVPKEQFYRERSKWLKKVDQLQSQLIDEKNKRLRQLANLMSGYPTGFTASAAATRKLWGPTARHVSRQGGKQAAQRDPKTDPAKTLDASSAPNKLTGSAKNDGKSVVLNEFIDEISASMTKLQSELKELQSRYLYLYRSYKRLSINHKFLQNNYRQTEGRVMRLKMFQESELSSLKRLLDNETQQWRLTRPSKHFDTGNPEPVQGMAVTSDTLVDAGVRVAQWKQAQQISQRPKDCSDIELWTQRQHPLQIIYVQNRSLPVTVLCQDGWTIMQKNVFRDSPDARRTWREYQFGFGSLKGDVFWIGNEYLHWFSLQDDYQLRVEMSDMRGERLVSDYAYFHIGSSAEWYRLEVSDNSGSAGDILGVGSTTPLDKHPFSTPDRALDGRYEGVASDYGSGWWYPVNVPRATPGSPPRPCFTHLNHHTPWYCVAGGDGVLLSRVSLQIRPNSQS